MTEREDRDTKRRWQRRAERSRARREAIRKHGGSVRRVYADAIRKRAKSSRG